MKKTALTTIFIVLCTVGTYGYDVCVDGLYYSLKDTSATVTYGDVRGRKDVNGVEYNMDKIAIPSQIVYEGKTYTITEIGDTAFCHTTGFSQISIPNTVVRIGKSAFQRIYNIKSIDIPSSVAEIGEYAFEGCKALEQVSLSENLTEIQPYTFCSDDNLKSIVIPPSVKKIGESAFGLCYGLDSISFSTGLEEIGKKAFTSCVALKEVNLPDGLNSIGMSAFFYNKSLTKLTIPSTVSLIDYAAFSQCLELESVVLPDNLEELKELTFGFCEKLKHVVLPTNLKRINDLVFNGCSLEELDIPGTVEYYGKQSCLCDNLKIVNVYRPDPVEISSDVFSVYNTLHVVKGSGTLYQAAANWNKFTIVEDLEPTGISTVKAGAKARAESWYDLQGRQVTRPEKGRIYIHDGRKVVK